MWALILGCTADYSVRTEQVEQVVATEIYVDSFVQASKPEQIDVLVLLDTSCSMNDNYSQVSTGIKLLRNDASAYL